ncbi:MAG TPA: ABC transporter substrate-binding protein [Thermomicrobiales bacterium]|nr:hypothetical protein [Chloroflexota bacterium]HQZ91190.1 ABC transporter substrate-binding protein [Thermomicrobiales bacterium]
MSDTNNTQIEPGTQVKRRTLLRFGVVGAGMALVAPLLAACGGSSSTSPTATTAPGGTGATPGAGATVAPAETPAAGGSESSPTTGAGTGSTETVDRTKVGGQLILGRSGDSDTLDPQHTTAAISHQVFSQIYDTLIGRNMNLEFEPIVSESYEAAADGLSYTFKIRKDLKFHDGTPLNAEAVKFTFDRVTDPKTAAPSASWVDAIASTDAVDEVTVRMNLNKVFSPLLGNISIAYFGILSPAGVEKHGDDFGKNPVGSGPFVFKEWVPGERITLTRNEDYVNVRSYNDNKGAPYLEQLVFRNMPEEQTQVAAMETGEINLLATPAQQIARFDGKSDYTLLKPDQSTSISFLEFSLVETDGKLSYMAPFDDLKVRQAVAYAIDADTIIERILQGTAVRNYGVMPTGNWGYTPDLEKFGYHYDPKKANDLLDEAGWTKSGDVRQKDGKKLEFVFWTWNATTQERIAQVIQGQLGEVGISAKLETMEVATLLARLKENSSAMDLMGWGWSESDLLFMMTDGDGQFGLYQKYNPDYAKAVVAGRSTSDMDERAAAYLEAMKIVLADCAAVSLWSAVTVWTVRSASIKGVHLGAQGAVTYLDAYQEL